MKGIIMESRIEDHGISRRFVIPESASLLDMDMVVSTIMWMEPMSDGMTVLSMKGISNCSRGGDWRLRSV